MRSVRTKQEEDVKNTATCRRAALSAAGLPALLVQLALYHRQKKKSLKKA